jgi:hypothetical protein
MRWNTFERAVGTTFSPTWQNSGAVVTSLSSALIDRNGFIVDSVAAIASGNGCFYALHQLGSNAGPYVNEWRGSVGSYEYVNRQYLNVIDPQVD